VVLIGGAEALVTKTAGRRWLARRSVASQGAGKHAPKPITEQALHAAKQTHKPLQGGTYCEQRSSKALARTAAVDIPLIPRTAMQAKQLKAGFKQGGLRIA
jgi:hypothetical protein